MPTFTLFRGWFQRKSTTSFSKLDPEAIRRERIRIEQTEIKITKDIEDLEQHKAALFTKGTRCTSDRQRLQIARKIKELDGLIRAKDQQLALISKNQRVLQGVAQLKENERLLRDLGMEGLVGKMDLTELHSYIEQSTVEGQFQMERFTKLLESLDGAESVYQGAPADAEIQAIVEAMQQAAESPLPQISGESQVTGDTVTLQRVPVNEG